jgi:lytic murein transglycosylase
MMPSAFVALGLALGALPVFAQEEFAACLAKVRKDAVVKGIDAQVFDSALDGVEADPSVIEAMEAQPEFVTPIWDYLASLVDEQRIDDGREALERWGSAFAAAEQRFGVDRYVIAAVWGVESNYGRNLGGRPLVRSLATTSCYGHRQRYFRSELIATLRILQSGDMPVEALRGSWAGAFGQTQFMPSTYQRLAVDFDGDGRRDIVSSVPDAIGSTAHFLARAGWQTGEPWGYEVALPADYGGPSGRRTRQPLAKWAALGITRIDGTALTGGGPAALLLPSGAEGPAFLVFRNFNAIYSYNAAESYALAIAHLSDRLRGGGPFVTKWPTDDPGLSRAEKKEVQQRLLDRGYDIGAADGAIGPRTRAAIAAFQDSVGLPADGRAGMRVLSALRAPAAEGAAPADRAEAVVAPQVPTGESGGDAGAGVAGSVPGTLGTSETSTTPEISPTPGSDPKEAGVRPQ